MVPPTPHDHLRRWLPHLLLLGLLAGMGGLLATVLWPLADALLMSAALTALTYPVLFEPLSRRLRRWLPRANEAVRQQAAGLLSTLVLLILVLAPVILLLLGTVGTAVLGDAIAMIVRQDAAAGQRITDHLVRAVASLAALYPSLGLEPEAFRPTLADLLRQAGDFRSSFLAFLFAGFDSLLVTTVLAFLLLTNGYIVGGRLVHLLLRHTPLSADQCRQLALRHRQIVLRLLNDSLGTALVRGTAMGLVVGIGTGLPVVLVALAGTFLCLVPIIGHVMVWLPLVALQWSAGAWGTALALGFGCLFANLFISWARRRLGRRIDDESDWLGLMLFLGLIGGVLGYGVTGLVIGPLVAVLTVLLARHLLPLYRPTATASREASADQTGVNPSCGR
jgi:predicted PurR-regulated permease PerM